MHDPYFLGLDLSSQSLTATSIDQNGTEQYSTSIPFSNISSEPVRVDSESREATSSPLLFIKALDRLLQQMRDDGFPFDKVAAICGSAQQHGSVYLKNFDDIFVNASPEHKLSEQIDVQQVFSFDRCPIWMDASTSAQCAEVEQKLGGPRKLAEMTGSRAYERFTGVQILKRAQQFPSQFAETQRVALISAFMASLLCGSLVPEDVAEASGTNMFNISNESGEPEWWTEAVEVMKAQEKLASAPVRGLQVVGKIAPYFQKRYGFSADAVIRAFSGDNPCSLAAMGGLEPGDLLVSLGTSDTVQWVVEKNLLEELDKTTQVVGHTFRSPLSTVPQNIRMLVFCNGSLTREAVKDGKYLPAGTSARVKDSPVTWEEFDTLVNGECSAPRRVGIFHLMSEILPRAPPTRYPEIIPAEPACTYEQACRLVLEYRALTILKHASHYKKVLLTGGASASTAFRQILADVLNAPVHAMAAHSAALGAAFMAKGETSPREIPEPSALPRPQIHEMYRDLIRLLPSESF